MRRLLSIVAFSAACGGETPMTTPPECVTPPTYATDIAPLVARACIRCHDENKVNAARQGAPIGMDFNRFELITDVGAFADSVTSGRQPPAGIMPAIDVSAEDRDKVNIWRKCGYAP